MKKCPVCGNGKLGRSTRLQKFKYKKKTLTFEQPGLYCSQCSEVILERGDKEATDPLIFDFQARVDGRLTTTDIRRIRKKLALTQREAGEIIGGGPNAFSRYEKGKSYPTRGTENFLRLLDKHPGFIKELKAGHVA